MALRPRDEFSQLVKRTLAHRVGLICSNPDCRAATSDPQIDPSSSVNVGVAAHITGAAPVMCAATPTLTELEGSICGPDVAARQSGLEQINPTRWARVRFTNWLNSSLGRSAIGEILSRSLVFYLIREGLPRRRVRVALRGVLLRADPVQYIAEFR